MDDVAGSDAVRLFVERARVHDPGFVLDRHSAPVVASACRRLDGIPLALELAAARLSSMSIQQVSERLDQRFRLLIGGSRDAMPRQQTLQATVDWSFGLLTGPERDMLRQLSVFAGGFELTAAEAVCATGSIDAFDVVDLLGSLVDKSLVVAERVPGSVRYRLLDTIRQYAAQELLKAAGQAEVLRARDRHAGYYLRRAETAAPALAGPGQGEWLARLDLDWDNLRGAAAHLVTGQRTEDVLRLGVSLQRFAASRGHLDVLAWLRQSAGLADPRPRALLADALVAVGWLTGILLRMDAGARDVSERHALRALELARDLGDRRLEARALLVLGGVAFFRRDLDRVRQLGREGVRIARELGDVHLRGELLACLAICGQNGESRRFRLEALDCFRQSGDALSAAAELHQLYGLDMQAGQLDDARAHLTEAVATTERLGAKIFLYYMRTDLVILLLAEGKHAEAAPLTRRCLLEARRMGPHLDVCELLFGAACCTVWQQDHRRAARLFGAADAGLAAALAVGGISWTGLEQRLREQEQGALRRLIGDEAYETGYRSGARLTRSQAAELALGRETPG